MAPNTSANVTSWMTDNQEEGVKSRGALIKMHPNGFEGKPIRVFPYNYVPDSFMIAISVVVLGIFGPLMAVCIGGSLLAQVFVAGFHKLVPAVLNNAEKLIMGTAQWAAKFMLKDERNYSYLPWELFTLIWAPAIFFYAHQHHMTNGFSPLFFVAYHVMRLGPRFRLFAHAHVLFHKEGHNYKGIHKGIFSLFDAIRVNQNVIGMFYGQTPMSYETGHNKIHHRFDNGLDDMHTNLDLDRSKPISLLIYFPRFYLYWGGVSNTIFFINRRMWNLAIKSGLGCVTHHVLMVMACQYNLSFGLAYVVYPFVESVIFFALISYLWHAWMDPADPSNAYVNSVTILDGHDNIWNEDYHVVHHVSKCHWSEYPAHYEKNKQEYIKSKATIFRDCEEGEMIHWMLSKQWDKLAEHFVDLEEKMTHEEKKELLLQRLRATISKVETPKTK